MSDLIRKILQERFMNEDIELVENLGSHPQNFTPENTPTKSKSYEDLAKHAKDMSKKAKSKESDESDFSDFIELTQHAVTAHHAAALSAIKSGNSRMAAHHIKAASDHHEALL